MKSRANAAVYWPGINNDISNVQYTCLFCNSFQQICVDYFETSGHHYLSFVDRFSGWLNIYDYPPHKTIVDTLIITCRAMFINYSTLKN